ncbi:SdiA-regulated domain-containing protein [Winogradskyella undariae]|uniref:SdiA-regulated domain-containing protein n=1 Tax=Winogradskyella TaxID=286104 RepID=UPI00156B20D2|nr:MULTISPECIES: SdiA-regulated domain-containing protein [Winogradskyella]NRR90274.1 SdiA-regulated domain-containing protein [Winogradskyella undariae]QXP77677.1 SdiA-regulated domain-containing protein [Winogradskyella sp. HaHa_3_26]
MNFLKSHITIFITILFGIILLALQKPITDSLVNKSNKTDLIFSKIYEIKNTYYLPEILNEISGIVWISENVFAGIQDEDGYIYIYDIEQKALLEKIKFANSGDYEGLAINNDNAYVMRSDGVIYEVKNYRSTNREVSKFKTLFTEHNNIESLTFDKDHNQLLLIPKDEGLIAKDLKCIYKIPINTKQMDSLPLFKIDLKADVFKLYRGKKIHKTLNPSDIAIHPKTKDIYVLEGKKPKLVILNSKGEILKVLPLDERKFTQAEGITFSEDGRLFISNEFKKKSRSANILEVELK